MRPVAAEKQSPHRSFVARPVERRAHSKELIKGELAVKNVSAGEPVDFFEVVRRDDLHAFDQARQVRRILRQCLDYYVAKFSSTRNPAAVPQREWRELHVR